MIITDEPQSACEREMDTMAKKSPEQKVVEGEEGGGCRGGYQTNGIAQIFDRVEVNVINKYDQNEYLHWSFGIDRTEGTGPEDVCNENRF